MISIIVPTLGRADRISSVIENVRSTTSVPFEIIVVVESHELDEYMYKMGPGPDGSIIVANERSSNYAGAVNSALRWARGEYLFMAADDLKFHSGWDQNALWTMVALDHIKVVGTNDLLNPYVLKGWHATHYLVDQSYLQSPGGVVDGGAPGVALFEGYDHNYTDTEFIGTAKARAVFAPCLESVVEHLHYSVGKSDRDTTYLKGGRELHKDAARYMRRRELWWNISK